MSNKVLCYFLGLILAGLASATWALAQPMGQPWVNLWANQWANHGRPNPVAAGAGASRPNSRRSNGPKWGRPWG